MIKPTNDNTAIAVIQTKVERIQIDIEDIKEVLKSGYVTKDSLILTARETEARLVHLETASNLWKWLAPVIAATMGSVFTFLIIQYLMGMR